MRYPQKKEYEEMKNEPEKLNEAPDSANSEPDAHSSTAVDLEKTDHKEQVPIDLPIKKDSSPKKKWLFVGIALLLIAAVAVGLTLFTAKKTQDEKKAEEAKSASATKFGSAVKLIDTVKPQLRGATLDITEYNGLGGKTSDGFGAYSVPSYKVGDRKYANLPGETNGISYKGTSVQAEKNYKALEEFFKKNKFKTIASGKDSYGVNQWFTDDIRYVSYASYESDDLLCMIWHADAAQTSVKDHVTSLGCANKSSYEAAAKSLDPLFAAYTKGESSPADKIVLGDPVISEGADDYLNIVTYQEDPSQLDSQFQGLYYKKESDKDWTYFTGSYGPLSCSEYKSDTLKKAFKDFNCYDDKAQAYKTVG